MTDDFKPLFLARLTQLLDAKGMAERERTTWLRDLLEIDLSSANRKLKGGIAFNIEEVAKVAKAVSCSTDYLLGLKEGSARDALPGLAFQGLGVQATLLCDRLLEQETMVVSAKKRNASNGDDATIAWISRQSSAQNAQFIGWKDDEHGGWWLGNLEDAPEHAALHRVYASLALDASISAYRVAVLDDRAEAAEVMQGFLEQAGYAADTYTRVADLSQALQRIRYDAFVLDWSMGRGETTEGLMEEIRQRHVAGTPIMLITGEASELEIERAIDQHGVRYFQKTGLFKPIIAQLKKDLREQG
ncbi:helix-turn-helix domain-containing protein [Chromobacterium vaccinii]|uniref:Helix-turn-helix domain-containing protein n=1 Tax=Chromobacterium vaccinii TaxID=1108595 RepID=A0ABV0FBU2_9NEIS